MLISQFNTTKQIIRIICPQQAIFFKKQSTVILYSSFDQMECLQELSNFLARENSEINTTSVDKISIFYFEGCTIYLPGPILLFLPVNKCPIFTWQIIFSQSLFSYLKPVQNKKGQKNLGYRTKKQSFSIFCPVPQILFALLILKRL